MDLWVILRVIFGFVGNFGGVFENLCLTLLLVDCTLTCEWLAAPTDEGDASDHSEKTKNAKR